MAKKDFKPKGLATAIGSMPHTDPAEACSITLANLPEIPVWPQLPQRSFRENMYAQYSEAFPGLILDTENERMYVDSGGNLADQLERLYTAYLENDLDRYAISEDYAAGFRQFLALDLGSVVAVKGQVTGAISFGLTVTDENRRSILYEEVIADAVARHLRLKAAWMEKELARISPNTILFVDEPYLASLGSAFVALSNDMVIRLTNEVLGGISGLKGMHCCGNTDWSVLMSTDIDILNFDAYNYGETLALYPDAVKVFLDRGGVLAWGIVPSDEAILPHVTSSGLLDRLHALLTLLSGKGIEYDILLEQCLITPSCGLASLSLETAARALELTRAVSEGFRLSHRLIGKEQE